MILKLQVKVNIDNYEKDALTKVIKIIRPAWFLDGHTVKSKVFTDGITNKLVGYFPSEAETSSGIIVKIYGVKTELLIDRAHEIRNLEFLHSRDAGPELFATFLNGIAYAFVPGTQLTPNQVTDPVISRLIAHEMAKWHGWRLEPSVERPIIWTRLWKYVEMGREILQNDPNLRERLGSIPFTMEMAAQAVEELEEYIAQESGIPLGFCHNDLLLGNVIYSMEDKSVKFIDFEYAGINYTPLDIANHFCEFAGLNEVDYSKYPSKEFQKDWLRNYLGSQNAPKELIESYLDWIRLFTPIAHLMWTLTSVIQAAYSNIDFDYVEYLRIRWTEFHKSLERFKYQKNN